MPKVSVVLGTWNRIQVLPHCINAIKRSIGNIPYEIIVVDGGSTDGTLEYLAKQPDIITVRQGKLVGACRAFNAGFRLARAPYVVHINDDDIPQGDCIVKSVRYMESHPEVGQGAYAFDGMWGSDYRCDSIFGVSPYANKGITRRELGDRAQWWTELFYTYAGDVELACRIVEMGYKIAPLLDCRVHDLQTRDELRRINNPEAVNPDSEKFYARRKGLDTSPCTPRRVLHVALNVADDRQPALERALRSMGKYRQVDWHADGNYKVTIENICRDWKPNLVFMQFQTSGVFSREFVEGLKAPNRTVVNWSGDVRHPIPDWYFDLGKAFDLTLVTNEDWVEEFRKRDVKADYLQIGFNQEIYHPWGPSTYCKPVVFLGSHYGSLFPLSDVRLSMAQVLKAKHGSEVSVYGSGWPFGTHSKTTHQQEVMIYRGTLVATGCSQLDLTRYTSDRLFRAMGSGAFYLTRYYPGIEKDFERGVHLDWWNDNNELLDKIDYYIAHNDECKQIARTGCELVHSQHTWLDRIYQLTSMIGWHQWK